ncbi:unnamed protein product [Sphenostylis stenocarpa]|uniref:Uncharacterized protein n=1 Tax=Sphenostylis stenocarpa TaxID=92480 RepID=A0AA86VZI1_9FABA|nr:unnamed protein product [Sphenostylis stenocarpa]
MNFTHHRISLQNSLLGKFRLGENLLPCKVEEDHQTQRGFMAGIHVTYQPVVLEANQSPWLERAKGLPEKLSICKDWFFAVTLAGFILYCGRAFEQVKRVVLIFLL